MPIHDWTRVKPGIYHHFHGRWIFSMADALNVGGLPKGFYALAEQMTRTFGPDVLTLERPGVEQPHANGTAQNGSPGPGTQTLTHARPKARFEAKETRIPLPKGQRKLAIRHSSDHRLVALIELVSPGNKASTHAFKSFVEKACGVLEAGLHLLVIDPFPPGKRDPNGVHAAVWHLATRKPFTLPSDKPLTLASYVAGEELTTFVNTVAVGDPLPDMALFLDADTYVNVPLEATYQTAWQTFPAEWREVITGT
jgi:hypothetical protein